MKFRNDAKEDFMVSNTDVSWSGNPYQTATPEVTKPDQNQQRDHGRHATKFLVDGHTLVLIVAMQICVTLKQTLCCRDYNYLVGVPPVV